MAERSSGLTQVGVALTAVIGALTIGILDPVSENPYLRWSRNALHGLTGAGGSFGFFSPNIGNQILVHFRLEDGRVIRLHDLVPSEVALRIGNMYRLFIETYGDENIKRSVAASLTAQIFRRFPDAKRVTFIASVYRFPTLTEFSKGQKPQTKEIYRITFESGRAVNGNRHAAN